jgi:hypothetical protein
VNEAILTFLERNIADPRLFPDRGSALEHAR